MTLNGSNDSIYFIDVYCMLLQFCFAGSFDIPNQRCEFPDTGIHLTYMNNNKNNNNILYG